MSGNASRASLWGMADTNHATPLGIDYCWRSVEKSPGEPYVFPLKTNEHIKTGYSRPAVYRWAVYSPKGELRAVYFGETENLFKRVNQYLRPRKSQQTNMRLHLDFHRDVDNKWTVKLDFLDFSPFRLNSILASMSGLHVHFLRKMIEAFVILDFVSSGAGVDCTLLNLKINPIERRMRRAIKIISETTTQAPPHLPGHLPPKPTPPPLPPTPLHKTPPR